ncbi:MAG: nickel-dependent lactate racemase [bacterium]
MSRRIELEFGRDVLGLELPDTADVLRLPDVRPLADPSGAIYAALATPLGAPPFSEVVRVCRARHADPVGVIVISDNTRPVPYRGADGILEPLLELLRAGGFRRIKVLVATGTHRVMSTDELRAILTPAAFLTDVQIINHDCRDNASLCRIGSTQRGTEIWLNQHYLNADLKILTGLVEPHFMAGVSGGPKSVCPGLVGEKATTVFHGARMMADARAVSLQLENNPCQAEAMEVAVKAGVDFIVNVTISRDRQLTGVFAGALEQAHRAAAARVMTESVIPIRSEYDVVVTHAGFVGINHYQAAKAAVEGSRAVRPGGTLILAANNTDLNPVGGPHYRRLLPMLTELGIDELERRMLADEWCFVPEQWELQMWGRALRKLGHPDRLIYCSPRLTGAAFHGLPGCDGGAGLAIGGPERDLAAAMVQRALDRAVAVRPGARVAVLVDGPYGIPREVCD